MVQVSGADGESQQQIVAFMFLRRSYSGKFSVALYIESIQSGNYRCWLAGNQIDVSIMRPMGAT